MTAGSTLFSRICGRILIKSYNESHWKQVDESVILFADSYCTHVKQSWTKTLQAALPYGATATTVNILQSTKAGRAGDRNMCVITFFARNNNHALHKQRSASNRCVQVWSEGAKLKLCCYAFMRYTVVTCCVCFCFVIQEVSINQAGK